MESKEKPDYKEKFKLRIRQIIDEKSEGVVRKFASSIGVSVNTVNNWIEYGSSLPKPDSIKKICETHSVSADWLVCGKGDLYDFSISRWDFRMIFWMDIWRINPDYWEDKLEENYADAFFQKALTKIGNNQTKYPKTVELIKKAFNEWTDLVAESLRNLKLAEDIRKKIYVVIDDRLERKQFKKDGKSFFEELSDNEKAQIIFHETEGHRISSDMKLLEFKIESYLEHFEEG
jgi:hypothetical protein